MAKKQFKTESKKILDLMVNSIYTHKEIFLRELISNGSDAIDKLYFRSLTDPSVSLQKEDYEIRITADKEQRTLTISDNGCGMNAEELEKNLGTIARSGSLDFKSSLSAEETTDVDIIGQFGVGFYSAFMVSDHVLVISKAYGENDANEWESSGADGYTVRPSEKESAGTTIVLHLKADTDDEKYSDFLEEWKIRELVHKYSDYVRYPIRMLVEHSQKKDDSDEYEKVLEDETLNSMIPIWKKDPSEVTEDEYSAFYTEKFYDYEKPIKVIRQTAEGTTEYIALLFIPSHAPYDYYSKEYEKGLQLYSSGVMIMDKCKDLVPDHFSFVRGLVDSSDLSLNISREMLQEDRQLKIIAKALEKKIASELQKFQTEDREKYESFFKAFGSQLKYGVYADFGMHKDLLQDLLLFPSSFDDKLVTLKEYVSRMPEDQKKIYYATGESVDQIKLLPQVEAMKAHGYEVLFLTEDVDEFALQIMRNYRDKEFANAVENSEDLSTEEEKKALEEENKNCADMLQFMKDTLGDAVTKVQFSNTLGDHAVALTNEGPVSMGMEKVLNRMPGMEESVKAQLILEINSNHEISSKLKELYGTDQVKLSDYTKILYGNARLVSGLTLDNPSSYSDLITSLML
ncbi:MAG: molecular chaperone HtpG [Oscillospiraceae bacterium]|nr:molecular chaperone HtpG [Oscillospiraceae bacterium]